MVGRTHESAWPGKREKEEPCRSAAWRSAARRSAARPVGRRRSPEAGGRARAEVDEQGETKEARTRRVGRSCRRAPDTVGDSGPRTGGLAPGTLVRLADEPRDLARSAALPRARSAGHPKEDAARPGHRPPPESAGPAAALPTRHPRGWVHAHVHGPSRSSRGRLFQGRLFDHHLPFVYALQRVRPLPSDPRCPTWDLRRPRPRAASLSGPESRTFASSPRP